MVQHDKVREILLRDLKRLRAREGYLRAGLPLFPGLFGRDSLIAAWQMLYQEPSIAKETLVRLANLQGKKYDPRKEEQPGKILHEYYEPRQLHARFLLKPTVTMFWGLPYFGSIDATPLWLILLGEYIHHTHDTRLLSKLLPNVRRAVQWLLASADSNGDGFIDYQQHNSVGLVHQAWKDSDELGRIAPPVAPVEAQGYAYAAWLAVQNLAGLLHAPELLKEAQAQAVLLRRRVPVSFRLTDGFFAFALDGKGAKVPWHTSNPGHLLFSGILDSSACEQIITHLFSDEFWTPFGIRTLSVSDPQFDWQSYHRGSVWPHDNWFVWLGLMRQGRVKEARRIRDAMLLAFEALGGILPELYGVSPDGKKISLEIFIERRTKRQRPNYPQAWASGALLSMLGENYSPLPT